MQKIEAMPPRRTSSRAKGKKGEEPLPWNEHHPARQFLFDEIATGRIPLDSQAMGPREVFQKYQHVRSFRLKGMEYGSTFASHLRGLQKIVARYQQRSREDKEAFNIAFQNHPASLLNGRGEPHWNGSDAQRLLKEDIEAENHLTMKPS